LKYIDIELKNREFIRSKYFPSNKMECWILDAGFWILDTGSSMLDGGCWMEDAGLIPGSIGAISR
jgi:hypothetical protein